MKLSYITRANSGCLGKPRVFFACHPDDHAFAFDLITTEVLDQINCAIFYLAPAQDTAKEEQHEQRELLRAVLEKTSLFIIPVTSKLLFSPNHAVDTFLPYALQHNIAILPIMLESGLDKQFNTTFGNLHYLTHGESDPSALPYREKLKRYLESVLLGDDLATLVKEAFDAYIFLSYRKKDRQHAKELIHLIHQNKAYRDIAIWYDEYLTPGEDFNDAIKQILTQSDLFVMVVTPSLLEPGNYISTTEYPLAQSTGIHTLYAEMVTTDKSTLEEQYSGISDVINAKNRVTLAESLLNKAKQLALNSPSDDPAHLFFIGLAYLHGIDVEVDHSRALSLLTDSAEKGLPEAAKQLVAMYRNGLGVACDQEKVLYWQSKAVAIYKALFDENPNRKTGYRYACELMEYGRALYDSRLLDDAIAIYTECQQFLDSLSQESASILSRLETTLLQEWGEAYKKKGDTAQATKKFHESVSLAKKLYKKDPSSKNQSALMNSCLTLSVHLIEREQYDDALKLLNMSHSLLDKEDTASQGFICYYTAKAHLGKSDYVQALLWQEKCLNLDTVRAKDSRKPSDLRSLAVSYDQLGWIYEKLRKPEKVLECYTKAFALFQQVAEATDTLESYEDLSYILEKCSRCEDEPNDAEQWLAQKQRIDALLLERQSSYSEYQENFFSSDRAAKIKKTVGRIFAALSVLFGIITLSLSLYIGVSFSIKDETLWTFASVAAGITGIFFGVAIGMNGFTAKNDPRKKPELSFLLERVKSRWETHYVRMRYRLFRNASFVLSAVFFVPLLILLSVNPTLWTVLWPWYMNFFLFGGSFFSILTFIFHILKNWE